VNKPLPRLRHVWFDKFRNGLMPFASAMCCSIIRITPLSTCWNCCARRRLTQACWQLKSIFIRVAKDSRIIDSMIHAAHNGKKVTVVVELQARFDEELTSTGRSV
jgi:polyphosphate kinase